MRRAVNHQPIFWGGAGAFTETEKSKLLGPALKKRLNQLSSFDVVSRIRTRFLESAWEPSHVNWMTYMDLSLRLPELLMMRVDKMSMATSLEARVPFLDHKVVTLALSIPSDVKFRDGVNKHILKRAVSGVVPREIIDRPKQGFGVPLTDWLLDSLGDETRNVVERFCNESGLLNWTEAEKVFSRNDSARIWTLWNLAAWWSSHFENKSIIKRVGK
jgi:asparagine synthase (glutamine-hydrolysing)